MYAGERLDAGGHGGEITGWRGNNGLVSTTAMDLHLQQRQPIASRRSGRGGGWGRVVAQRLTPWLRGETPSGPSVPDNRWMAGGQPSTDGTAPGDGRAAGLTACRVCLALPRAGTGGKQETEWHFGHGKAEGMPGR